MGRLAIIGGHSLLESGAVQETTGFHAGTVERLEVATDYGSARVLDRGDHIFVQRHGAGEQPYVTAARLNHRATISALEQLGCDRILAIGSVGGLSEGTGVGTVLCPDDFIALQLGISFGADHVGERVPAFDGTWRERVLTAWRRSTPDREIVDGGVYWQAIGPRFETPAEIRLIAAHADVIGMTIASECILAGEIGISYAAVCIVDNLANGVGGAPLAVEDFEAGKATNRERLDRSLAGVIEQLGDR